MSGTINMYFHLSTDPDLDVLTPRVPKSTLTKPWLEDRKTPRVCFSTSINGALNAITNTPIGDTVFESYESLHGKSYTIQRIDDYKWEDSITETERFFNKNRYSYDADNLSVKMSYLDPIATSKRYYYVYVPAENPGSVYAPVKEVADQQITGEVWIQKPVKVKRIGWIIVLTATPILPDYKAMFKGKEVTFPVFAFNYAMYPNNVECLSAKLSKMLKEYNKMKESKEENNNGLCDAQKENG